MHSEKKLKKISPVKSTRANSVVESDPPGHLALNTTLKTKVYIVSISTGLRNDQAIPKNEPR